MPNSKRRLLRWLLLLFGLSLLFLLAIPVWLPWVLRPALSRFGVEFGSYQREGYGRFALSDVHYGNGQLEFRADRVSGLLPYQWLWKRYVEAPGPFLHVERWELRVSGAKPSPGATPSAGGMPGVQPDENSSLFKTVSEARRTVHLLRQLLPRAQLENGTVVLPSQRILLPRAGWNQGQLNAQIELPKQRQNVALEAALPAAEPWKIHVAATPAEVDIALTGRSDASAVRIEGAASWQTNHVVFMASFPPQGWLPSIASASSESFHIPAQMLGLDGYRELAGSLAAGWTNGEYRASLSAQAEPLAKSKLFPAQTELRVMGTTNWVRLDKATIRAPWLSADVSEGATFDFSGRLLTDSANVRLRADLAKQPWRLAEGQLSGDAQVRASKGRLPDVDLRLVGDGIKSAGIAVDHLEVSSQLNWPRLTIQRASARLTGGATLELIALANLETRSISNGVVHVQGSVPPDLLPARYSVKHVLAHADFRGPWDHLAHEGIVELDQLIIPRVSPLHLNLEWTGASTALDQFTGLVRARDSALRLAGSANAEKAQARLRLTELTLATGTNALCRLDRPFAVSLSHDPSRPSDPWSLALEPLLWRSAEGSLDLEGTLQWPRNGSVHAAAINIDFAMLRPFLQQSPPAGSLDRLAIEGGWTNGPVKFTAELAGRFNAPGGLPVAADLKVSSDGTSVALTQFQVAAKSETVLSGQGTFPLHVELGQAGRAIQIDETGAVGLHALSTANPAFWRQVSQWTGVTLTDPRIELDINGPLSAPAGTVTAQIATIHPETWLTNRALPKLEDLRLNLELSRSAARLQSLQVRVEDQPVLISGWVPFGTNLSTGWRKFFQWEQATGTVNVADAQIAPFGRFLPRTLSPQGVLNLEVSVRPKLKLEGDITLKGAATRPIPSVGVIDELQARLHLAGRGLKVEALKGLLGGEPFTLAGDIDFDKRNAATGLPMLDLSLRGQKLPLARQPDLILRSDLDIRISNRTNDQPVVSGVVRLRDSVLLSDLKVLVPGKIAHPRQRPPYFSVDVEPLADWRLDLQVRGDRFLKVRSPFFRGVVSTTLKLEGSLGEPVALGDASIASGVVLFPFASLDVTQGLVSLTSADPFHPQLFVSAGARTLGYDVKMEVTGKADSPVLQFSSTPPLSSEQVLLMITTGAVPEQENSVSTQQRASRLAMFVGRNLLSEFSSGQGAADRLTLRSGEYVSEQGKQTYSLEYRLSPKWSLVGEYDRFGAYNAEVKWRLYSR